MRRPIWMLSLALAMTLAAGAAAAATAGLTVELNQARRIALRGEAANVVVANPAIADVAMTDQHSVVVIGKGFGVTEILITDHNGHTLLDSRVAVVGSDEARVTLYHGVTPMEYSCSGRCQIVLSPAGAPAAAQPSPASNGMVTMTITQPAPVVAPTVHP